MNPLHDNPWGIVHIAACFVALGGLTAAFFANAVCGLQRRMLKSKRVMGFQRFLPPLDRSDRVAYRMVAFGFLMLTIGVATGIIWSLSYRGIWWSWDPKETWSLITWLVYAAYLHVRVVNGWQGKWTNWLLVAGFACVLVMVFGVNYLSDSWHRAV